MLTRRSDLAIEVVDTDVVEVIDSEVWRVPSAICDSSVKPVLRSMRQLGFDIINEYGKGRYPLGPVVGVTSSVAPCALELEPTPGLLDCALTVTAAARAATIAGLRNAIVDYEKRF